MRINRRVMGIAAFGGLVAVLAIPSSEVLTANIAGSAVPTNIAPVAPLTPAVDGTETASITPAAPLPALAGDPAPAVATETASVGPQVTVTDRATGTKRVIPATGKVRNLEDNLGAATGKLPDAKHRARIIAAVA